MQKISKKLYTTSLVTLLTLSMILAALPLASAVMDINVDPTTQSPYYILGMDIDGTIDTIGGLVEIYWDEVHAWDGQAGLIASGYASGTSYEFTAVGIPEATEGDHYVIVRDASAGTTASAIFTIVPNARLSRGTALVGDTLTITGYGFAADSDLTVEYFDGTTWNTLSTRPYTPTTDDVGSFSLTFEVPSDLDDSIDNILVTDDDSNSKSMTLEVGAYITLSPSTAYVDSLVEVSGRGFEGDTVDVRLYLSGSEYVTLSNNFPISADGTFTTTIEIPTLPDPTLGGKQYDIEADDDDVQVWATFTLIQEPTIELNPNSGVVDDPVEVDGTWFSAYSEVTITFDGDEVATVTANAVGSFTTYFDVPDVADGSYVVTATDAKDLEDSATFKVSEPVMIIRTRANEYAQNDYMSIYAYSTSEPMDDLYCEIVDPAGLVFWAEWIDVADWALVDKNTWMVPYDYIDLIVLPLPADAPTGTWNFTAYTSGSRANIVETNSFTVSTEADMQAVLDSIEDLDAKITSISNGVATITTDVGDVYTIVSNLDISSLTSDLVTIKTNLGTLTASVDTLEATVTAVAGDVATVSTTLGDLEGTITSIDGDVATIKTDVGTLKADISDITGNVDNTPAWIAVVLALVAAVAAIFAVITIRQKIAG
ncbi:MAG: hypothetical protein ACOWW1_10085 [archaeon]